MIWEVHKGLVPNLTPFPPVFDTHFPPVFDLFWGLPSAARRVGRARSARLGLSEAFLGRLPFHYEGRLHVWGRFYMGGTVG